jgi:hypothetical protein
VMLGGCQAFATMRMPDGDQTIAWVRPPARQWRGDKRGKGLPGQRWKGVGRSFQTSLVCLSLGPAEKSEEERKKRESQLRRCDVV